jgi:hypothetical protein
MTDLDCTKVALKENEFLVTLVRTTRDKEAVKSLLGRLDGWAVGWLDGCAVGWQDGWLDGWAVVWLDGWLDGCPIGWLDGWQLGDSGSGLRVDGSVVDADGDCDGDIDKKSAVGMFVGWPRGDCDGDDVIRGRLNGSDDRDADGTNVDTIVGLDDVSDASSDALAVGDGVVGVGLNVGATDNGTVGVNVVWSLGCKLGPNVGSNVGDGSVSDKGLKVDANNDGSGDGILDGNIDGSFTVGSNEGCGVGSSVFVGRDDVLSLTVSDGDCVTLLLLLVLPALGEDVGDNDVRGVGDREGSFVGDSDGRVDRGIASDGDVVGRSDGDGVGYVLGLIVYFSAGGFWTFGVGSEEGTSWRYVLEYSARSEVTWNFRSEDGLDINSWSSSDWVDEPVHSDIWTLGFRRNSSIDSAVFVSVSADNSNPDDDNYCTLMKYD